MPTYRFRYFNAKAFGEVSRLLFALAGQGYEDARFTQETWPAEKPNTPLGQMPVLDIDGKSFGQSSAISRYLARTFGFYGNGDLEALAVDQVLGVIQDVITALMKSFQEKDEAKKAELRKELADVKIPLYFGMLEKLLKNNGSTGLFVGKKISLADVSLFDLCDKVKSMVKLADYPLVKKCNDNVGTNPKIKAWVEKRPVTEF
ncbi:glutathione S-transferase 1-like [Haliotis rufescens]|uniref:glutathione S-transferase 1-like n=1 Tax=Haliotis rufescens TaxID=6454 RepID=UPI00201F31FB|nr:glutathione S-transferase 1-like [Haliotis rufescens]